MNWSCQFSCLVPAIDMALLSGRLSAEWFCRVLGKWAPVWLCKYRLLGTAGAQRHLQGSGVCALFGAPQGEQGTTVNGRYCILEKSRKATHSRKSLPLITAKQNGKRSNLETWERRWRAEPRRGQGQGVCVCTHTHRGRQCAHTHTLTRVPWRNGTNRKQ